MDGLLVDSEPLSKGVWRNLLGQYGHYFEDNVEKSIVGLRAKDSARVLIESYGLAHTVDQLVEQRRQVFLESINGNVKPMPGMYKLLDAVAGHGLTLAVATSNDAQIAQAMLKSVGIHDRFSTIVSGDMVEKGKPAPDIYLAAARAVDVLPAFCLALEDSPMGVKAAIAAGMKCIAVPNELTAGLDLSEASWIFPSLGDIADELDDLLKS